MSALPPDPLARIQPHNLDAEQELLGAILVNNAAYHKVNGFLRAEHFFHEAHRRTWTACATMIDRGERVDPVKLVAYFGQDEVIAKAGGTSYFARLAAAATTVINAEDYAHVVHDLALRREVIGIGEGIVSRAYDPRVEDSADDLIEQGIAELQAIPDTGRSAEHRPEHAGKIAAREVEAVQVIMQGGKPPGLKTGIRALDAKLGGMHPQDLIIVAGRPSMGKTALVIDVELSAAIAGDPAVLFSLEQSKEAVTQRLLSRLTGIPFFAMRTGHGLPADAVQRLDAARRRLDAIPLWIDDTGARTPVGIQSELLRLNAISLQKYGRPIALAAVDYLQLCRSGDRYRGNKVAEIGEITGQLKNVAKRLNIPIIALSQLSRAVESRDDKRPQMSDLRESGAIEQDADVIMFPFRAEYYESRKEPRVKDSPEWAAWDQRMDAVRGTAEIIIEKNRSGAIGTARIACNIACNEFTDLPGIGADLGEPPAWVTE